MAKISAWSVALGIVVEDFDSVVALFTQPTPKAFRAAIGGGMVALGIAAEIWFSGREAKAERKTRNWYAERVSQLTMEIERADKDLMAMSEELESNRYEIRRVEAEAERAAEYLSRMMPH